MARRDGTLRPPLILACRRSIMVSMEHMPDGWIETRTGYVAKEKSLPDVRIRRKDDAFRVSANLFGFTRDLFEADLETCLHLGDFFKGWAASEEAWKARSIRETRQGPGPKDTVTVRKVAGDPFAHIAVHGPDENDIAKLTFSHTSHRCCYAVGTLAIDGSPHVAKAYRGKGLSNFMHDLASEISGLPFVPHGRNLCGGFLTPDGKAFWDARSIKRNVPGHGDTGTAVRTERIMGAEEIPDLEREYAHGTMPAQNMALALALIMPGRILGVTREFKGQQIVDYTWFVPDGKDGVFAEGYRDAASQSEILAGFEAEGRRTGVIDIEDFVSMLGFRTDADAPAFDARAQGVVGSMRRGWGDINKLVNRNHGMDIGTGIPDVAYRRLQEIIDRCKTDVLGAEPGLTPR